MKIYSFDFTDENGEIVSIDLGGFDSDVEACHRARSELLKASIAVSADVWLDGKHIAHVAKEPFGSSIPSENGPHGAANVWRSFARPGQ
jgi:hypothetical protein